MVSERYRDHTDDGDDANEFYDSWKPAADIEHQLAEVGVSIEDLLLDEIQKSRRQAKRIRDHHNSMAKVVFPRLDALEETVMPVHADVLTMWGKLSDLQRQVRELTERMENKETP